MIRLVITISMVVACFSFTFSQVNTNIVSTLFSENITNGKAYIDEIFPDCNINNDKATTENVVLLAGGELRTTTNIEYYNEHDVHMGSAAKSTSVNISVPEIECSSSVSITVQATGISGTGSVKVFEDGGSTAIATYTDNNSHIFSRTLSSHGHYYTAKVYGNDGTTVEASATSDPVNCVPTTGYNTVDCDSEITISDATGTSSNYGNNYDGYTIIEANPCHTIHLTGSYDVGEDSSCEDDYIEIYEGEGTSGFLLGTYIGTGNIDLVSTVGEALTVRFVTDNGNSAYWSSDDDSGCASCSYSGFDIKIDRSYQSVSTTANAGSDQTICEGGSVSIGGDTEPSCADVNAYDYCDPEISGGGTDDDEIIKNVTIKDNSGTILLNKTSSTGTSTRDDCEDGTYSDFTSEITHLYRGTRYEIFVTGHCRCLGFGSSEKVAIHFDWNNDGDFDDSNEYLEIDGSYGSDENDVTNSVLFYVPTNAVTGSTLMRVGILNALYPDDACGFANGINAERGEAEDYTLCIRDTYEWTPSTGLDDSDVYQPTASPSSTTTYICTRSYNSGCDDSDQVKVTVVPGPTITTQPVAASICYGDNYTMSVVATYGTPSLTYQWQISLNNLDWTDISSETSSSYTTENLTTNTYYRVLVSASGSGCGSATSESALVTVFSPITAGSIASNQSICYNTSPTILEGTTPTGGDGSYTYQWQSSTNCTGPWADISNATLADYQPNNLTENTYYRRKVSNTCGTAYSTPITPSDGLVLHYTFDDVQEPTTNLVQNPNGTSISNGVPGNYQPGWDASLHTDAITVSNWGSGYNGGVTSDEIGYHARWVFGGVDGDNDPCMLFQDENNTYGLGHRWLGISQNLGTPTSLGLSHGDVVTISWYQKTDVLGKGAKVGLYHKLISSGGNSFESNISTINVTNVGDWERVSFTTTIGTDWDLSLSCTIYVYGNSGSYGKLWVDKVQLEAKDHATPYTLGTRATAKVPDYSGNDNNGTIAAATTPNWTSDGIDGGAYEFDGNSDYIHVPNFTSLSGATEFTVSFWANLNSAKGYVFWKDGQLLLEAQSTQKYRLRMNLDNGWRTSYTLAYPLNTWHNVVLTWDGTDTKMYLNGVNQVSSNQDASYSAISNNSSSLEIGKRSASYSYLDGSIDDVRIYDQALSAEEIADLYNNSLGLKVTVKPLPEVLVLTGSTICTSPGGNGTITSTTSVNGVNYQLYNSGGTAVQAAKPGTGSGLTWSELDAGNGYYAVGTDATTTCVSENSSAVNITTNANPTADPYFSSNPLCIGSSTTLYANATAGSGIIAGYEWSSELGDVANVSVSDAGTYTVTVIDDNGCVVEATSPELTLATPSSIGVTNGDYIWSGNTDNDWETASNWLIFDGSNFSVAANVPVSDDNVIFRDYGTNCVSNEPQISSASGNCNDITIESGLTLTMSNNQTLNVSGNWNNFGTFTSGTGTVSFNGGSPQTITTNNETFNNVVINNSSENNAEIIVNSDLRINGQFTLTKGIVGFANSERKVILGSSASCNEGDEDSFVDGIVEKIDCPNTSPGFTFPTGDVIVRDLGEGDDTYVIWAPFKAIPVSSTTINVKYLFSNQDLNQWWYHVWTHAYPLTHTSSREYWRVNSGSDIKTTLYWKNNNPCTIHDFCEEGTETFNSEDLTIAYWDGIWKDAEGTATTVYENGSITSSIDIPFVAKGERQITFGATNKDMPLPVELLDFTANCLNTSASIVWQTASETNNDYFILEKSNGIDEFYEIARLQGAGNSNIILDYNFVDDKMFSGENYYRLTQVDFDGKTTAYNVINLNCDGYVKEQAIMYAYPNPFKDEINVVIENIDKGEFTLEILDDLGRVVYIETCIAVGSDYRTSLKLNGLRPAVYNLRIKSNDNVLNARVVKR